MPNGLYKTCDDKKSVIFDNNGNTINSVVYTDPLFSKKIIDYFSPQYKKNDIFLDPCKGDGSFYNNYPKDYLKDYCEIQENKDFFKYDKFSNWIITNPSWEGKVYAPFANRCFQLSNNVIFLVKLFGAIGTTRRLRDALTNNHKLKEIIITDWKSANFTFSDGSKKAGEGFVLAIVLPKK